MDITELYSMLIKNPLATIAFLAIVLDIYLAKRLFASEEKYINTLKEGINTSKQLAHIMNSLKIKEIPENVESKPKET